MKTKRKIKKSGIEFVVIGTSSGGLQALQTIFSGLPVNYPLPMAIVQHRGKDSSDEILIDILQKSSPIPVMEVEDKTPISSGIIYVAPADYHLLVERDHFMLSIESPVLYARPSIDVLFESAASVFRENLVGIILTGASSDGAKGLAEIKRCGGFTLVQDPKTAEADGMPMAAIRESTVDRILPLGEISSFLSKLNQQSAI